MAAPLVLLVEDTLSLALVYRQYLQRISAEVVHADSLAAARAALAGRRPDAILLDLKLPDGDGTEFLTELRQAGQEAAVVVVTAHGSVGSAVEAMRAGADDFLVKPFAAERLITTLEHAIERRRLRRIVGTLERERFEGFVGADLGMQAVYRMVEQAARSKATVFVTGESGTGKEVCAEAIHSRSQRADGPFVALNAGAIPRDLVESEVFGHVRGAFTGAHADREGAAARAHGGTLFLDEICEMDLGLQAKLLRFLQDQTVRKVGSDRAQRVDIRIVCATNRDPLAEVAAGRFREDLYYRLHVIPIHLPPLRERGEDAVLLARHFLQMAAREEGKRFDGFTADAEAAIQRNPWPGNVRQLQNVIRTVAVLHEGGAVDADMLSLTPDRTVTAAPRSFQVRPLAQIEREAIERTIEACNGNLTEAAARLGINVSTIYRKRQSWAVAAD